MLNHKFIFISMEIAPNSTEFIITLETRPWWIEKLFGAKPKQLKFLGRNTVWHNMETNLRAGCTGGEIRDFFVGSTLMEGMLMKIYDRERAKL